MVSIPVAVMEPDLHSGLMEPDGAAILKLPPRRWLDWLPLGLTLAGLGLTAWVLFQTVDQRRLERQRLEGQVLKSVSEAVQVRLSDTVQHLQGMVGLFAASEQVSRREFRAYYDSLSLNRTTLEGIQGLGFSRWIPASQLRAYEATVRAEGFRNFVVRPVGRRPGYSSITYLEPFDWRNQRAFGFDMWSEPVRREAMARARDSGLPALSGKVVLVQETQVAPQAGILIYLPIYRNGATLSSVEARQQALFGWIYSPLRMENLVRSALVNPLIRVPTAVEIQIFDGESASSQLLFDSRPAEARRPAVLGGSSQTVQLWGRPWRLTVALPPDPGATAGELLSLLVLGASGTGISLLVGTTTLVLVRQHRQLEQSLVTMTRLNRERQLAATVFAISPAGVVITDAEARILQVNPAFTHITGYSAQEAVGQNPRILQSGQHGPEFFKQMWHDLLRYGSWEGELWNRRRDGQVYRQALSISAVRDPRQQVTQYVGLLRDVTEEHQERERVTYQSQHDYLTGLPNRALLLERLGLALIQAQRYDHALALLFLDLDQFKPINDRYGHAAGDWVLRQVAERLQQMVRASDTVSRLGGDEFVLLLPELRGTDGALQLARKLCQGIDRPYLWNGEALVVGVSIGIAIYPDHGVTVDELMTAADQAMYTAKHSTSEPIALAAARSHLERQQDRHSPGNQAQPQVLPRTISRRERLLRHLQVGQPGHYRWRHLRPDRRDGLTD